MWIIFEGDDGSGKTTLVNALKLWLTKRGEKVMVEQEGKHVIDTVPGDSEVYWEERLARRWVLKELMENGYWILQDRSWISTVVYQKDYESVDRANKMYREMGVWPDMVFILSGPEGLGRYSNVQRDKLPVNVVDIEYDNLSERLQKVVHDIEKYSGGDGVQVP